MLTTIKMLSGICYFSIFFAPFLCPVIIYFVVNDREVRKHAKKALMLHIVPVVVTVMAIVVGVVDIVGFHFSGVSILFFIAVLIINIVAFVWNIVKGIQVLIQ